MSSSYSKIPAPSSCHDKMKANPFIQARETDLQNRQRSIERQAEWDQQNQERNSRLEAWLKDCPHELGERTQQDFKTRIATEARYYRPHVSPALWPLEVLRQVERKWLESIGCDPVCGPQREEHDKVYDQLLRLTFLIQSLCQDRHLKRKSWLQEAIDLATQLGFEDLARNVIPHIRAWRQEFWDNYQ